MSAQLALDGNRREWQSPRMAIAENRDCRPYAGLLPDERSSAEHAETTRERACWFLSGTPDTGNGRTPRSGEDDESGASQNQPERGLLALTRPAFGPILRRRDLARAASGEVQGAVRHEQGEDALRPVQQAI
jgi:hypothetical protein